MAEVKLRTASVSDKEWVMYRDREEWKDIEPVPQNDGPYPVVAIPYSERFIDVYDYFRAVLKRQEKSERVLDLTKDALELNPANYTVWQYRREVLKHLGKDLKEELRYSKSTIEENPKNYQVWHHRRVIVEWLQDPSQELKLVEIIFTSDPKNYHAWEYRQWVIKTFRLFDKELGFVEQLLEDDIRNNSAWNERYFVINNTTEFTPDVVETEVNFAIDKIKKVTNNESAWNYLRGVMAHCVIGSPTHQKVCKFCEDLYNEGNKSPYLLAYIVDLSEELSRLSISNEFLNLELALEICDQLENKYDKIRCHYWSYIRKTLTQKMSVTDNSELDESAESCEKPCPH